MAIVLRIKNPTFDICDRCEYRYDKYDDDMLGLCPGCTEEVEANEYEKCLGCSLWRLLRRGKRRCWDCVRGRSRSRSR
jgi:anaerobic ribonucleoside-triphosphate reductase